MWFSYTYHMKHTVNPMDEIWDKLPMDLKHHVCNQLHKVRKIPEGLKTQIHVYGMYRERCKELDVLYSITPSLGSLQGDYENMVSMRNLQLEINTLHHYINAHKKWSIYNKIL